MGTLTLSLATPEDTTAWAVDLAGQLYPGDVLLLSGDVGAGKTHFARALISSILAQPEDVPSPTFTLVQTYETWQGPVWHSDLYRITSTSEIEELGLAEAFETAICLVEWPDRLADLTPQDALHITLTQGDTEDARRLVANWSDPKWTAKLESWRA